MKNCRPTPSGWQLYTKVRGEWVSEHLRKTEDRREPPSAMEIRNWVQTQHAAINNPHLLTAEARAGQTTFAEDVTEYLKARSSMPTLRWRRDELAHWLPIFGHRPRSTITSLEIRQQLEYWKAHGPKMVWSKKKGEFVAAPGPLANNTLNHRRTALLSLWTVLDGKSAANPVRDVPRYEDDSKHAPPRALPPDLVEACFGVMRPSKARAWLKVIRWTGWPHAQIGRLEPEHLELAKYQAWIAPRKKGKGVKGRTLPLLPQAIPALKEFHKEDAYGQTQPDGTRKVLSSSSIRWAWLRALAEVRARHKAGRLTLSPAAVKALQTDSTPYHLRHTFGTMLALYTKDRKARQTLMLHTDSRQTDRYEEAAVDPTVRAALLGVARQVKKADLVASVVASPNERSKSRTK